jgi:hypothetical protein
MDASANLRTEEREREREREIGLMPLHESRSQSTGE